MKYITTFLLTLTMIVSYGQDNSALEFKRVQIGFNISPDICYRTLKSTDGSAYGESLIKDRNRRETVKIGYTAGLNACFNLTKSFGLETGIQYSNKGYQTKIDPNKEWNGSYPLYKKAQFIYNYHYIDIPVKAIYTIGNKKIRFMTSVGFTTNVFIKETKKSIFVYSDRTDRSKSTDYEYNKVNISPTISAGIDYKINDNMNLRLEPTFRYGVLKIKDAPVTGYLYSGGLNIGYYFGL